MSVSIPALPFPLAWENASEPPSWQVTDTGFEATAAAKTDWYVYAPNPGHAPKNATKLLGLAPEGDWQFSAKIAVGFTGVFDAGTLLLKIDEDHWSKLALEYSPERRAMVVSVVTRGTSDDANGWTVAGSEYWLRVSRLGPAFVFHASGDGQRWEFLRSFAFGAAGPVKTGLGVQAPEGEGCTVRFSDIVFKQGTLAELRDGS